MERGRSIETAVGETIALILFLKLPLSRNPSKIQKKKKTTKSFETTKKYLSANDRVEIGVRMDRQSRSCREHVITNGGARTMRVGLVNQASKPRGVATMIRSIQG